MLYINEPSKNHGELLVITVITRGYMMIILWDSSEFRIGGPFCHGPNRPEQDHFKIETLVLGIPHWKKQQKRLFDGSKKKIWYRCSMNVGNGNQSMGDNWIMGIFFQVDQDLSLEDWKLITSYIMSTPDFAKPWFIN